MTFFTTAVIVVAAADGDGVQHYLIKLFIFASLLPLNAKIMICFKSV